MFNVDAARNAAHFIRRRTASRCRCRDDTAAAT
jgi:hypothetical protein